MSKREREIESTANEQPQEHEHDVTIPAKLSQNTTRASINSLLQSIHNENDDEHENIKGAQVMQFLSNESSKGNEPIVVELCSNC